MSLAQLDKACKKALPLGEKLIDAMDFAMTAGGEIEWYALVPPAHERLLTHEEAHRQIMELVTSNPELVNKGSALVVEEILFNRIKRNMRERGEPISDSEVMIKAIDETVRQCMDIGQFDLVYTH